MNYLIVFDGQNVKKNLNFAIFSFIFALFVAL